MCRITCHSAILADQEDSLPSPSLNWIDDFARGIAGSGSRRSVLRAFAGLTVGTAMAERGMHSAAAETPPPIPDSSMDRWPVCSDTRRFYCVDSFSADGIDQLSTQNPEFEPWVLADRGIVDGGVVADRLQWSVFPVNGNLQMSDLVRDFQLGIRAGRLEPFTAFMRGENFEMTVTGAATTGWYVELHGKPAVSFLVPSGGHEPTDLQVTFQGVGFHRTESNLTGWGGFEGYVAASGIDAYSPPRWRGDGWQMDLWSFHFRPDGSVNHGSYRAWMSLKSLRLMKLSLSEALRGALTVTRIDDGVESAVAAVLSELDGGVLIDIPDLTFSSPTISIRKRGKGGCVKKCRKGRVCKNGRCKKKKKRGKH